VLYPHSINIVQYIGLYQKSVTGYESFEDMLQKEFGIIEIIPKMSTTEIVLFFKSESCRNWFILCQVL